jgi:Fe-Mn family superoxide dismutase
MFTLPDLPYGYGDLMPVISGDALRTHHGKHHARYVQVTNEILASQGRRPETLEEVVLESHRAGDRKLFNNAAQAWNHGFFWNSMRPDCPPLSEDLNRAIKAAFGSLDGLRSAFQAEGAGHFGSGWVWLVAKDDALSVVSTHDAATPLTASGTTPLLVCDVWEHAYYLDHKNDRSAFLSAWWDQLVDWHFAAEQFEASRSGKAGWRYPAQETVR